jgi:hypothetical protein
MTSNGSQDSVDDLTSYWKENQRDNAKFSEPSVVQQVRPEAQISGHSPCRGGRIYP